jgi:AraC-like DNA-binding protein
MHYVLHGTGFSIGVSALLAIAFATAYRGIALPWQSRVGGYGMLLGLSLTQFFHARFLSDLDPVLATRSYVIVVFGQSLGFYWLFLGLLRPLTQVWRVWDWIVPAAVLMIGFLLAPEVALLLAMAGGTAASIHLGILVYRLRAQRQWFALEIRVLLLFAFMAVAIAAASLAAPLLGWHFFAALYATLIAASFGLVLYLLLRFPDVANKAQDAVATTYAVSTLTRVDRDKSVAEVKRLFEQEKIYTDENLSLGGLAEMTQLSPHQLSELINTQFEMGFSRLVRYYRVEAAKKMLVEEPRASVLSVGLSVGFTSQSNFYVAFKEFTGVVPGQYRKQATSPS